MIDVKNSNKNLRDTSLDHVVARPIASVDDFRHSIVVKVPLMVSMIPPLPLKRCISMRKMTVIETIAADVIGVISHVRRPMLPKSEL